MAAARTSTAPAPRRRGVVVVLLLLLAVVTSAVLSQIWTRLKKIEYGYKISKASRENTRLLEINRRLRIEVALLKQPARIHRYATEELGMSVPQPEQVRRLRLRPGKRPRPAREAGNLALRAGPTRGGIPAGEVSGRPVMAAAQEGR